MRPIRLTLEQVISDAWTRVTVVALKASGAGYDVSLRYVKIDDMPGMKLIKINVTKEK